LKVLQHLADGLETAENRGEPRNYDAGDKNHTYQACQKLGADNRAHLIAVAFQAGIIK